MQSDYEYSDEDDIDYTDEDEMMDVQEDDGEWHGGLLRPPTYVTTGSASSDDDMDMDAFNDDFKVPSKGKRKSYEIDYETLTQSMVEKLMAADIEHISGIFGVDVCIPSSFVHFVTIVYVC